MDGGWAGWLPNLWKIAWNHDALRIGIPDVRGVLFDGDRSEMDESMALKPMPIWQTILAFGVPLLLGIACVHWLLPALAGAGVPEFWNFILCVASMFPLLLALSLIALRCETGSISWAGLKDRFRLRRLSGTDWIWTAGLLVVYVGGYVLLSPTAKWLASALPLPIPSGLPQAMNPNAVQAGIPTEFLGVPLLGSWEMLLASLVILVFNVIGEEFWWRGYILPRQELRHGRFAWLLHAVFCTLFHLPFWWNLIALLPCTLSVSYVVSKTKNSTPGLVAHFVQNGLAVVLVLLGVLGVGS